MSLAALEKTYEDFYVPSFVVKVGGEDLVRDLFLAVTKVEVDLKEKDPARFSFSVASAFDWEAREFVGRRGQERIDLIDIFAFGDAVEIKLGYGEAGKLEPMLNGIITEVGTSFAAGGTPELTVSGYDGLFAMGASKETRRWEKKRDSDAVRTIADANSLSHDVMPTDLIRERIDQNAQTDLAFLEKLAEDSKFTFYMRGKKLHFRKRRNDETGIIELGWGSGLSSFSPTANIARQVTDVEVHGWSAAQGKAVVGKAGRGDESGKDGSKKSGGDHAAKALAKAFGKKPVYSVNAAVRDEADATQRAKAILEERAQEFLTGDGECVGLPALMPDVNIKLTGLGRAFSRTYYVSGATHTLDGSGYRTRFQVQETGV
jgi:phage protein D